MIPGAIIAVVLTVGAVGGMAWSWSRRARRQRGFALPFASGTDQQVLASASGTYLATTLAGRPLERIVAGGLGFRAPATLSVTPDGVLLERRGSAPLLIDHERLAGLGTATWTIDRAVERDGLTVLRWRLGDGDAAQDVESSLRFTPEDRAALAAALDDAPARKGTPNA